MSTSPRSARRDDVDFCQRLVTENGVAAIPVSAFYAEGAVKTVVRFCFAKHDATLDAALERLADLETGAPDGQAPSALAQRLEPAPGLDQLLLAGAWRPLPVAGGRAGLDRAHDLRQRLLRPAPGPCGASASCIIATALIGRRSAPRGTARSRADAPPAPQSKAATASSSTTGSL